MNPLPPFISLRALAVELCPAGRPLNAFKWELRRLLRDAGVEVRKSPRFKGKGRYFLSDIERAAPYLVESWTLLREQRKAA